MHRERCVIVVGVLCFDLSRYGIIYKSSKQAWPTMNTNKHQRWPPDLPMAQIACKKTVHQLLLHILTTPIHMLEKNWCNARPYYTNFFELV